VGQTEVNVYVTHLSHLPTQRELRKRQAEWILRTLAEDPGPKILMGDLNDGASSAAVTLLAKSMSDVFAQKGVGPPGTFPLPLFFPAVRIDYVFASPEFAPISSFVLRVPASDHYPVVADLEVEQPSRVAARGELRAEGELDGAPIDVSAPQP
jgi:endonuclease/exonuclease/phosphatase family metal-dependent hydrolase